MIYLFNKDIGIGRSSERKRCSYNNLKVSCQYNMLTWYREKKKIPKLVLVHTLFFQLSSCIFFFHFKLDP